MSAIMEADANMGGTGSLNAPTGKNRRWIKDLCEGIFIPIEAVRT